MLPSTDWIQFVLHRNNFESQVSSPSFHNCNIESSTSHAIFYSITTIIPDYTWKVPRFQVFSAVLICLRRKVLCEMAHILFGVSLNVISKLCCFIKRFAPKAFKFSAPNGKKIVNFDVQSFFVDVRFLGSSIFSFFCWGCFVSRSWYEILKGTQAWSRVLFTPIQLTQRWKRSENKVENMLNSAKIHWALRLILRLCQDKHTLFCTSDESLVKHLKAQKWLRHLQTHI